MQREASVAATSTARPRFTSCEVPPPLRGLLLRHPLPGDLDALLGRQGVLHAFTSPAGAAARPPARAGGTRARARGPARRGAPGTPARARASISRYIALRLARFWKSTRWASNSGPSTQANWLFPSIAHPAAAAHAGAVDHDGVEADHGLDAVGPRRLRHRAHHRDRADRQDVVDPLAGLDQGLQPVGDEALLAVAAVVGGDVEGVARRPDLVLEDDERARAAAEDREDAVAGLLQGDRRRVGDRRTDAAADDAGGAEELDLGRLAERADDVEDASRRPRGELRSLVVLPMPWTTIVTSPRSALESAIVIGIRSPCSWTRRITNWPAWRLRAMRGASMRKSLTSGAMKRASSIGNMVKAVECTKRASPKCGFWARSLPEMASRSRSRAQGFRGALAGGRTGSAGKKADSEAVTRSISTLNRPVCALRIPGRDEATAPSSDAPLHRPSRRVPMREEVPAPAGSPGRRLPALRQDRRLGADHRETPGGPRGRAGQGTEGGASLTNSRRLTPTRAKRGSTWSLRGP